MSGIPKASYSQGMAFAGRLNLEFVTDPWSSAGTVDVRGISTLQLVACMQYKGHKELVLLFLLLFLVSSTAMANCSSVRPPALQPADYRLKSPPTNCELSKPFLLQL